MKILRTAVILILGGSLTNPVLAEDQFDLVLPIYTHYMGSELLYTTDTVVYSLESPKGFHQVGYSYEGGQKGRIAVDCLLTPLYDVSLLMPSEMIGEPIMWPINSNCGPWGGRSNFGFVLLGLVATENNYTGHYRATARISAYKGNEGLQFVTEVPAVKPARKFLVPSTIENDPNRGIVSIAIVNPQSDTVANVGLKPEFSDGARDECHVGLEMEPLTGTSRFINEYLDRDSGCLPAGETWIESDVPIAVGAIMNSWRPEHRFWAVQVERIEEE